MRFTTGVFVALCVGLWSGAGQVHAQDDPHPHGVTEARFGTFPFLHDPVQVADQSAAGGPEWADFQLRHGGPWTLLANLDTGTPHRIFGSKGASLGTPRDRESFIEIAGAILRQESQLLGVDASRVMLRSARRIGPLWSAIYEDRIGDLPVRGSRIEVRLFRDGSLVLLGADTFPATTTAPWPSVIDDVDAVAIASAAVNSTTAVAPTTDARVTEVVYGIPGDSAKRPVRGFEVVIADHQLFVNGSDGVIDYARCNTLNAQIVGDAMGFGSPGVRPDIAQNPPELSPLAFLDVIVEGQNVGFTSADGSFDFDVPAAPDPALVEATLTGPFVNVDSQTGANLTFSASFVDGVPGQILFNDPATGLATAQVNGFIAVNRMHSFITTVDDTFTDMDFALQTNVNVSGTCNAFYSPTDNSINFLNAGTPCPNTAYSTIIYHEYNHSVVNAIYGAGNYPEANFNEGIADGAAALAANDPRIGMDFISPGQPIRDVDLDDRFYPDDLDEPVHQAGLIIAGSFWDTRTALVDSLGDPDGVLEAGFLYIASLQLQPDVISPDVTVDVLMVDDNDGDISNGTPHYAEIAFGFGAHGLDAPPVTPTGDNFIRGDADASGDFNGLVDSLFVLVFQFQGGAPPPCFDSADADDSGGVNGLVDALFILVFQFQGGSLPPAPFPACGSDPTDDAIGCDTPPCP